MCPRCVSIKYALFIITSMAFDSCQKNKYVTKSEENLVSFIATDATHNGLVSVNKTTTSIMAAKAKVE